MRHKNPNKQKDRLGELIKILKFNEHISDADEKKINEKVKKC